MHGCDGVSGLFGADIEDIKLEVSILQSQLNSTNYFITQSLNGVKSDLSLTKNKQKNMEGIIKHQDELICMLKQESQRDKEKLANLENILSE